MQDKYQASPRPAGLTLGKSVLLASFGLTAMAGVAQAAEAEVSEQPPSSVSVAQDDAISPDSASDKPIGQAPEGSRLELHLINDSIRDPLGLFSDRHLQPDTENGDDNGWTAEVRLDYARTKGNRQTVTSGRFQMATERGSWDPDPGYRGYRQDIFELTHQVNHRISLGNDGLTTLSYGLGGGLQMVGPMGGRQLQEFVHRHGPLGGRIGTEEGLQYNYTTDDISVSPVVTGGVKWLRALDPEAKLNVKAEVGALLALPVDQSISAIKAEAGIEAHPFPWMKVDVAANLTETMVSGRALDFMDADGLRPGGHAEVEFKLFENVRPFVRLDVGGIRDEPVYRVGITIPLGGGDRPWIDTPWK